MPLNLASPGIVVREVDLTVGRVESTTNKFAGIVAPFEKGPVNVPTLIENEKDLVQVFGVPHANDKHYESWFVASSFLSYGGTLRVVRSGDINLKNGMVGAASSIIIESVEDYNDKGYGENTIPNVTFCAKNPGSWSNNLVVAVIDSKADQILSGIATTSIAVGYGITQSVAGRTSAGIGTTSIVDGYLEGIITEINASSISVKVLHHVTNSGTINNVAYQENGLFSFSNTGSVAIHTNGSSTAFITTAYTAGIDWFKEQTITLPQSGIVLDWDNISERPSTTNYGVSRGSRFDEIHIVVIDDNGSISGNSGTILEKHLGLSKASNAEFSFGSPSYWRRYLASNSQYIFGGSAPVGVVTTGYSNATSFTLDSDSGWDQPAENVTFAAAGSQTLVLTKGTNYDGGTDITANGSLTSNIGDLSDGYAIFESAEDVSVDFLLMGSVAYPKEQAQALAKKLMAVASSRKNSIAFISPYRGSMIVDSGTGSTVISSPAEITENLIGFYSALDATSYAVFDSGYKYMYDRFSDTFRYIPLNGDIAGTCVRTDINSFPWYSPAGTTRGVILNAVKLAYNPTKSQRDRLYSNRINPIIFSPGAGFVLFGDKTALEKTSAFDRINVRRLFIYLEESISNAAKDQLFEFNDEVTRTNFVNIVEPFLRDVQSKRGIFDFVVICDETNNTASVIDNNEFIADIYIKPTRSINFIGLTFVATRTGVSFEEVIGTV
jgi:phage tail sheath protein FI